MRIETRSPRAWIGRGRLHESVSRERTTLRVSLAVRAAGRQVDVANDLAERGRRDVGGFTGGLGHNFLLMKWPTKLLTRPHLGRDTKARDSTGRDTRKESCRWDKWTRRVL
jgi:hypothetical protein